VVIVIINRELESGSRRKPALFNISKGGLNQGVFGINIDTGSKDNERCTIFPFFVWVSRKTPDCRVANGVSTIVMVAYSKVFKV